MQHGTQGYFKCINLSTKKIPKGYILYNSIYLSSWKRQYGKIKNPISSCQGLGLTTKRHEGIFGGDGNVLYFYCGGGSQLHTSAKTQQTVHFRIIYFIVCKFYLNKPAF